MPFQSEKQRRYLHANHPEIAKRWEKEYAHGGILDITGDEEITTEEGNDISLVDETETGVSTLFRAKDGGTPRRRYFTGAYGGGNPNEDRAAEESHANEFAGIDSGGWDPGVSSPGTTSTGGNVNQPNIGPSLHGGPSVKETLKNLADKQHEEAVNTEFEDTVELPYALDLHGITPSKKQRIAIHNRNIKAKKENYEKALAEQRKKMRNMGLLKLVGPAILIAAGMPLKYALKGITVSPNDLITAVKHGLPVTKAKKEYLSALESAKGVILSDVDITNPNEMRNIEETTNFTGIMNQIKDLTPKTEDDDDTKGGGPELPPQLGGPSTEEMAIDYDFMGWMRVNQARKKAREEKIEREKVARVDNPIVGTTEMDIIAIGNKGGLANLFRVKKQ